MTALTGADLAIVVGYPPNFEEVRAVFPEAIKPGVMFCYGDTIYSPSSEYVPPQLLEHEAVHATRQLANFWTDAEGNEYPNWSPALWWKRYLAEPAFRFSEERFAHIAEYTSYKGFTTSRARRRDYLAACAGRLSGPLYNNMISLAEARKAIEEGSR